MIIFWFFIPSQRIQKYHNQFINVPFEHQSWNERVRASVIRKHDNMRDWINQNHELDNIEWQNKLMTQLKISDCSKRTFPNWLWYFWILWLGIKNQKIYFKLILHKKIFLTLSDCGPNMGRPWSGRSLIVVRSRFDHGQTMVRSWSDHGLAETEIEFGDECFLNHLKSSSTSRDIVI